MCKSKASGSIEKCLDWSELTTDARTTRYRGRMRPLGQGSGSKEGLRSG
jgi:hypothetical protein